MTTFKFEGIRGSVDVHGFVLWNGMGFQIEAASEAMRVKIEAAKAWARLKAGKRG